jgi:alternate signal-mediated exported protein
MNKTTKGALAAGTAAALLLGGAGSLAFWTDTASSAAGTITTGSLSLASAGACTAWNYASGTDKGSSVTTIVPGDQISKTCTFTVGAVGDHVTATPTLPSTLSQTVTSTPAPTTMNASVAASYTLNGAAFTNSSVITKANNGQNLVATITVTFPFGSSTVNANDTKNVTEALQALSVTLTQTGGTASAANNNS